MTYTYTTPPRALTETEYVTLREMKTILEMQLNETQEQIDLINERLAENRAYENHYNAAKAMCDLMCD